MFEIVLVQPEIAPNTGNIMRLAANTGCRLHLVRPFAFSLSDRQLRRAGMDYRAHVECMLHDDWHSCLGTLVDTRMYALTTKGDVRHDWVAYRPGDALVFGPETRGLPSDIMQQCTARLRLPMCPGSRSLNLANAVSIAVYEAWRQIGYSGAV
jgi:tRNA (cytidine/uridine-2'-O-)-methyltransferase